MPFEGVTTVVKVGGAGLDRPEYVDAVCQHLGEQYRRGDRVVLVHGGGKAIARMHDALGVPSRTVEGLRVTSPEGMEITTMVLCGGVNKALVGELVARGMPAIGISGIDLGLLRATLIDPARLGRVGDRPEVAAMALWGLLELDLTPVISPMATGPDERPVNVNADVAADAIASAIRADRLDFVSDVPGIRTSPAGDGIARQLRTAEARHLLEQTDVITAGMIPKLQSAISAVESGVGRVRVGTLQGLRSGVATEILA